MKIAWSLLSLVLNVIMGQRNIDSILVRNISAVIPAGTVKIFDFELGFRARSNLQTVKASDFTGFLTNFYETLLGQDVRFNMSTPKLNGNSELLLGISQGTIVNVVYTLNLLVNDITSSIVTQISNLVLLESVLNRNILNNIFLLPTRNVDPEITGRTICGSVSCDQFRTCIEPDLRGLAADAECVSSCYVDYCKNLAICEHSNANFSPRCFCQDEERIWYFGARCQFRLEDWQLYLMLAALAILIIFSIICLLCIMCHKCKSKIKSEGTYIANSEDFNTVIESHHDISFEPSDLFTERSRKYSGSMINAHENINFEYQNDSGISNESPEVITKHHSVSIQTDSKAPSAMSSLQDLRPAPFRPRPGWVPSLGPAWEQMNLRLRANESQPEVTPLDTNV